MKTLRTVQESPQAPVEIRRTGGRWVIVSELTRIPTHKVDVMKPPVRARKLVIYVSSIIQCSEYQAYVEQRIDDIVRVWIVTSSRTIETVHSCQYIQYDGSGVLSEFLLPLCQAATCPWTSPTNSAVTQMRKRI